MRLGLCCSGAKDPDMVQSEYGIEYGIWYIVQYLNMRMIQAMVSGISLILGLRA